MKTTQRDRVEESLLKNGYATRNQFLRQIPAITRLGAIVCDMKKDGWELIEGYSTNKKDYQYKLVRCPYKKVSYNINGQVFVTWKK